MVLLHCEPQSRVTVHTPNANVRAFAKHGLYGTRMSQIGSHHQRRVSAYVLHIDIRTVVDEQLGHTIIFALGGDHQGGPSTMSLNVTADPMLLRIRIRSLLQERSCTGYVSSRHRRDKSAVEVRLPLNPCLTPPCTLLDTVAKPRECADEGCNEREQECGLSRLPHHPRHLRSSFRHVHPGILRCAPLEHFQEAP